MRYVLNANKDSILIQENVNPVQIHYVLVAKMIQLAPNVMFLNRRKNISKLKIKKIIDYKIFVKNTFNKHKNLIYF
jgi:hypothetical protein